MSTTVPEAEASTTAAPYGAAPMKAVRVHFPGRDVTVGPLGHLAAERHRLAELTWEHFDAAPQSATIGAEISGIDLRADLSDAVIAELRRALCDYKVLFFRDQAVTPAEHVAFARRFGPLELHPFITGHDEHPELVRFAKSADVGGYENGWHSDVSWRECPSMGAILHATQVPPTGGDTLFADMYAAYEGLDDDVKEQIDGLTAVHDFVQVFGRTLDDEAREKMRAEYPPVEHPVVRTHPETGRKLLYVNHFFVRHIVGIEADESDRLLIQLCREAAQVEYQCRFRWTPDAVAFWDNRAVQHYASSDYWPDVRIMERASVVGDRPH
ncbi:TauD/TfdA dioxygenase family protein [Aquihabitans sp. McL0605]|uniref:TauD/TfdA dioxygenase family protein n=1 Tax=Aquihabitans sp. McL0605 TaxID=3415671 RepID=UPI003CF2C540